MPTSSRNIRAGELFLLTCGEYSDYQSLALCRAKAEMDPRAIVAEYLTLFPDEAKRYHWSEFKFAKWLIVDKNICEEVPHAEFFLGAYEAREVEVRDGASIER